MGGTLAYNFGKRLSFRGYKWTIAIATSVHGGSYILFSQMRNFSWALVFIALSRAGWGITSVLNMWQLLRTVPDEFRGRVFFDQRIVQWSVMMLSMMAAGIASEYWNPRTIGAIAGALSSLTAVYWRGRIGPDVCPSPRGRAWSRRRWRSMESQPRSAGGLAAGGLSSRGAPGRLWAHACSVHTRANALRIEGALETK